MSYTPPLSVVFIWHPADKSVVTPLVDHCYTLLSRDIKKPFSRSMNLPIFYMTSDQKGLPNDVPVKSKKKMYFVFISKNLVADKKWAKYVEDMKETEGVYFISIALDSLAFNIDGILKNKNSIRAYEFDSKYTNEYVFLSVAHEIYRFALNDTFDEMVPGKDNALKIFLSHAKDGSIGIKLATALKSFIDNSSMRNFFDATDISPGYIFNDEIIAHIKNSTIIAIHSDIYSSRYWCQREILSAKENNRPMIAVDCLEDYEDRRFPYASNIPSVHFIVKEEPCKSDLLRILSTTLLETVRFFYSRLLLEAFKEVGWIEGDSKILSRPPDISDIEKLVELQKDSIVQKVKSIVYPEPPVYSEELAFINALGIKMHTPLTSKAIPLRNSHVGISISSPSEGEIVEIGQSKLQLMQLSQDLTRHLLAQEATIVYGGDLRNNGFTEFILSEAEVLQSRLQSESIHLTNYIAFPLYLKDSEDLSLWGAKYKRVAELVTLPPPNDVEDLIPSKEAFLAPTNLPNKYVWSRCLTEMRREMIKTCDFRICAGGKHTGYKGLMPGVLEEVLIALEMNKPLYLLGGFGGVTASICECHQNNSAPRTLTEEWQKENNGGYADLLRYYENRGIKDAVDYKKIEDVICNMDLNNGLSKEDNIKLYKTPFVEEALHLVLKGIREKLK